MRFACSCSSKVPHLTCRVPTDKLSVVFLSVLSLEREELAANILRVSHRSPSRYSVGVGERDSNSEWEVDDGRRRRTPAPQQDDAFSRILPSLRDYRARLAAQLKIHSVVDREFQAAITLGSNDIIPDAHAVLHGIADELGRFDGTAPVRLLMRL
jgi:hypothetical protein